MMPINIPSSIAVITPMSKDDTTNGKDSAWLPTDLAKDSEKEIQRLAGLNRLKYEEQRKPTAKSLGISVTGLDAAVKETRRAASGGGQGKPLELPEPVPWETSVSGSDLLVELIAALRRYVVMSEAETLATALWIVHAHSFRAFTVTPRLAITSPEKQCGKTTLLDLLSVLVPRPLLTCNVGAAVVFRAIEKAAPVLLIDEGDTFLSGNDELRGILNSGHRQGGSTLRCVGDDFEPRAFSTWAPCAIAMIGKLPDTLQDRSVAVRLRRRRPDEAVERLRIDRAQDLKDLARKIARWVADHMVSLSAADDPAMPASLSNRALDNWLPLVVIADVIGGEWPDRVRQVAEAMVAVASVDQQSAGPMMLADIKAIFEERGLDRLSTEDLLNALLKLDDRPWNEWKSGKPITKAGLSRLLSKFGLLSEQIRFGPTTLKGYQLHRFEDAFSRYLPATSETTKQANNDGDFSQNQNETLGAPVSLSKREKPLRDSGCFDVSLCGPPHRERGEGEDDFQRRPEPCAQCGAGIGSDPPGDPPTVQVSESGQSFWLHDECVRHWRRATA
jgi:putative DNA primase/helicase